jgi:PEP-CTERM motif
VNATRITLLLFGTLGNAFGSFTFYASETGIIRQFHTETGAGAIALWTDPTKKWNAAAWDAVREILYTSDMNTGQIYAFTTSVVGGVGYLNAPVAIYNYATGLGLDITAARSADFYNGSFFFTGFQGTQANLYQLQLDATGLGVTGAGQIATLARTDGSAVGTSMQSGDFVLNNTELYFVSFGNSKNFYRYDIAGRIGSFGTSTNLNAVLQVAQPNGFNAMTQAPSGYYVYSATNDTYYSIDPTTGIVGAAITTGQGLGTGDATLFTNTPFQPVPEPSSGLLIAAGALAWRLRKQPR